MKHETNIHDDLGQNLTDDWQETAEAWQYRALAAEAEAERLRRERDEARARLAELERMMELADG